MSVLWNTDYDGSADLLITTHFPIFSIPHIVCVGVCSVNILLPFLDKTQPKVRVHNRLNHWRAPSYGCCSVNSPFLWAANILLSLSSLYGIICPCLIYFQILGRPGILFHLYFHNYGMKDFCLTWRNYGQQDKAPKDAKQDPHGWISQLESAAAMKRTSLYI